VFFIGGDTLRVLFGGSNKTYVEVEKNETNKNGTIYTSKPKFTVDAQGYSAQATYTITGNIMYATVK
jgi:hypothetical protein